MRYVIIVQYFSKDADRYEYPNTTKEWAEKRTKQEIEKAKKPGSGVFAVIVNGEYRWKAK